MKSAEFLLMQITDDNNHLKRIKNDITLLVNKNGL